MSTTKEQVQYVHQLFAGYGRPWAICGGWALSLWLGRQSRSHGDIDIAVFRRDIDRIYAYFKDDWALFYIRNGREIPWNGEPLNLPVHQIRGRRQHAVLDKLELLMNETDGNQWLFRRHQAITYPLQEAIVFDESGIPLIAPEIAILYKAKYATEAKSAHDFEQVLPRLNEQQRAWLLDSVRAMHPDHAWLGRL